MSDVFAGDWTQLIIGQRLGFTVQTLVEQYAGQQIGILAHWRGDVALTRPHAFGVGALLKSNPNRRSTTERCKSYGLMISRRRACRRRHSPAMWPHRVWYVIREHASDHGDAVVFRPQLLPGWVAEAC